MLLFLILTIGVINALPESGHFEFKFNESTRMSQMLVKSVFKNTKINIQVGCRADSDILLNLRTKATIVICFNKTMTYVWKPEDLVRESIYNISCHKNSFDDHNISKMQNGKMLGNFEKLFVNSSQNYLTTKVDGMYAFYFTFATSSNKPFSLTVKVDIQSWYGYLSAKEWPLLIFYSIMCAIYSLFALAWLILSCRNWRDLLRIQFWVGAVIFLGMLEKAMFVSEYQTVNNTGISLKYPVLIAEIVSCVKRMLARILLMIVCIGYGIVKPRLGPALKKILGVGIAYLIAALVEGYIRVLKPELIHTKYTFIPDIMLVILDAVILWWSFSYLIHTIKQMRMRHNVVKFNLYRHFSNILIIVVIASAVFMVWALYTFKSTNCLTHWKLAWINEAYWHILFSIVLLTIMVLWRPSKNSQRYAYSPLLDADEDLDDEDDNDIIMDNMTEGELRKPNKDTQQKKVDKKTAEDDLKWIEDNIPASAAEKIYPLVDSDNEITPSKITAGKMD